MVRPVRVRVRGTGPSHTGSLRPGGAAGRRIRLGGWPGLQAGGPPCPGPDPTVSRSIPMKEPESNESFRGCGGILVVPLALKRDRPSTVTSPGPESRFVAARDSDPSSPGPGSALDDRTGNHRRQSESPSTRLGPPQSRFMTRTLPTGSRYASDHHAHAAFSDSWRRRTSLSQPAASASTRPGSPLSPRPARGPASKRVALRAEPGPAPPAVLRVTERPVDVLLGSAQSASALLTRLR